MRSGTLYQAGKKTSGQLSVKYLVLKLKTLAWVLRKAGTILISLSLLGMAWLYLPLVTAEVGYYLANIRLPVLYVAPVVRDWIPVDPEYAIYIPKIGANTKVVPNVNINDEAAYLAALKLGVAEVAGLSHPGKKGTTYLFAHSTDSPVNFARYNAVFYLLDKLEIGDEVQISYLDQIYRYQVNKKQILAANDTHYLIPQKQTEILVLQTCYPPGTSWKRLVIEARPVY